MLSSISAAYTARHVASVAISGTATTLAITRRAPMNREDQPAASAAVGLAHRAPSGDGLGIRSQNRSRMKQAAEGAAIEAYDALGGR